jgi:hypothetical protein
MRVADAIRTSESVELETADQWVDWMLRNYRRWHYSGERVGPEEPTHCLSIEHQYVPKYGDFEEDDEPIHVDPATEPVDERAGELTDRLLSMPRQYLAVLRAHYILWPNYLVRLELSRGQLRHASAAEAMDRVRAKRLGISVESYLSILRTARERLSHELHNNVMTPLKARKIA